MIETVKTDIDACHDLIQKVDLSTDQGHAHDHARRGMLGCTKCLSILAYILLFDLLIYARLFGMQYLYTTAKGSAVLIWLLLLLQCCLMQLPLLPLPLLLQVHVPS